YFQNKLAGAIGYGFALTDHRIALMTPIVDMLPLLDEVSQSDSQDQEVSKEILWAPDEGTGQILQRENPASLVFVPAQTPLLLGGFSPRAQKHLLGEFQRLGLSVSAQPGGGLSAGQAPLEPGSAFAVQLMRGDVNASAIGTVTYIKDGYMLGFGHPFLNRGKVNFLLTGATVHRSIPSISVPFKLGSPTESLGSIKADRGAGVAGVLGEEPPLIELLVEVEDTDRGRTSLSRVEIVDDPLLSPSLLGSAALAALDKGLDRVGPGTAWVELEIVGQGMPRDLVRENLFYSSMDIAAQALLEAADAVYMLTNNIFETVNLEKVTVRTRIQESRQTARIVAAQPERQEVRPGETIGVEVTLRPFRQEPQTICMELTIPEDIQPGPLPVTVRAGGSYYYFTFDSLESLTPGEEGGVATNLESLEKLIDDFVDREKNNEVILEFMPFYDQFNDFEVEEETEGEAKVAMGPLSEEEEVFQALPRMEGDGGEGDFFTDTEPVKVRSKTDYVVEGSFNFELTVEAPTEEAVELKLTPRDEHCLVK
ncbi:MAG: hypothetical protein ACOYD6_05965, partial [Limnochordia bacterium]